MFLKVLIHAYLGCYALLYVASFFCTGDFEQADLDPHDPAYPVPPRPADA